MTLECINEIIESTNFDNRIAVESTTFNAEGYPSELKAYDQWVLWKLEEQTEGKQKKIPYTTSGYKASTTNPESWSSFDKVFETYQKSAGIYSGLGFVFSEEDPFIGLDWDHIRDSTTGEFNQEIMEEITSLNNYTEISQSGQGFHVIAIGTIPGPGNQSGCREMYASKRFFAITGGHLIVTPYTVNEASYEAIKAIYNKMIQPKENSGSSDITVCQYSDIDILLKSVLH